MPGNNYTIPFGIDAGDFFAGLKAIDDGTDKMAANVVQANEDMQKGFDSSVVASDKLNKTIITNTAATATLSKQAAQLGRDLGDALSGKSVGADLGKKVDSFTNSLNKLNQQANKKINFNIDTAKLKQFEKMLVDGQNELTVLAKVSAYAKEQLKNLAPDSKEFKDLSTQIEVADEFLKNLAETSDNVAKKQPALFSQLRTTKNELTELALAGKENSEEFQTLFSHAENLQRNISNVNRSVKELGSNNKYISAGVQAVSALAGGFAVAQGAVALFGDENQDLVKVISKVTGAMAILQGIESIANALNKDSALSVLLFSSAQKKKAAATLESAEATVADATATEVATVATKSWTVALLSNPIFIIGAIILGVVAALVAMASSSDDAAESSDQLKESLDHEKDTMDAIVKQIDVLVERRKILNKTKFVGDEDSQKVADSQADLNGLLLKQSVIKANLAIVTDKLAVEQGKLNRVSENLSGTLKGQGFEEQNKKIKILQDQREKILAEGQDVENSIGNNLLTQDADRAKKNFDLRKKAIEDAKKAAEEEKKIREQQLKFLKELGNAETEAITNKYDKERAQIKERTRQKIDELEAEKSLSKKASETRILIEKQLKANEQKELDLIDKKEGDDFAVLQFQKAQIEAGIMKEGLAKELEQNHLAFTEKRMQVTKEFKDDKDTRIKLIRELNDAEQAEKTKIINENAVKDLKKQEEIEILQIQIATSLLGNLPKIEEQKQIDVLKVKLKYAQKTVDLLISQGKAENSLEVLQAKKLVQDISKELKTTITETNNHDSFSMFDLLGLGDLTDEQKKAVTDAAKSSLDSIKQITDFIVDQYQRQIDKKQEIIDQTEQQIQDLEGQLEKEKELRQNGFANNVDLLEKELVAKKKAKEDEIKQQQELQKKQQAIQRAQLIIDTISQASNLITAASNIFKTLSAIPFIGVPLAIATIALMTGAFIASKAKAFQAIGNSQSFGEGGEIDGDSHAQGGKKYYSADGDETILEGKEFVTKKSQAQKYKPLLHAINDDRLRQMNDAELGALLSGMGIHFENEKGTEAINYSKQKTIEQNILFAHGPVNDINELAGIGENVAYLANAKKNEVERWEDENFYYTKQGNQIRKFPKKK